MARGRTSSPLGLSARRQKAKELFIRGWTVTDVAREILVSPDTAARYKKQHEDEIAEQTRNNPELLRDVLKNTVAALVENDQIRQEAWRRYESAQADQVKATFLNTALKAQEQRAKILQLFGVKAEYMDHVARVQRQQERLIGFLAEGDFCDADRTKIVNFLETQETFDQIAALPTADL